VPSLPELDATELVEQLRRREVSAREVVASHLEQIERTNPRINAIVTLCPQRAMDAAAVADETMARAGPIGPLHGLPVAHKDLQDTAGIRTTYGSPIFADHIPETDSLLVERTRAAGAILVGKTNTPEFGAGSHTDNAVFGPTRNPCDPTRSAGGSSGGSAAALAARMLPLADGSDMGGSLRNPASFCNVVGLRPSAGLVPSWPSRNGWFDLAVDGALGRTVADVALYLSVLAGFDARCPLAWPGDAAHFRAPGALDGEVKGLRIAWCPSPDGVVVDPAVTRVLETDGRRAIEALGLDLIDDQPDLSGADESFRTLRAAHFAAAFGELYRNRRRDLNDMVAWNVEQGLTLRAADISAAVETRTTLYRRMAAMMRTVDALAMPVSQVPPFPVEERWVTEIDGHPQSTYLDWMRSCYLISATGLPAISVPCGFTPGGLPVGIQLVGRPAGDLPLLRLAHAVEAATGAGRRPPVQ
jgi:amidase